MGLAVSLLAVVMPLGQPAVAVSPPLPLAQAATQRPLLRLGSTGTAVSEVQAILTLLGYYTSPVDGKYQSSTEAAVRKFQQDVGLTSDGVVGPETWAKLLPTPSTEFAPSAVAVTDPASAETATAEASSTENTAVDLPVLRAGMRGPAVRRIQETLSARCFYEGPIDGAFGPMTEAAVMAFQRSAQLAADGIVGPATWRALLQ